MTRSNVHNADFFHYAAVNGFQPEVVYFDTQEEVLTALHEGRIDACPASRLQDLSVRVIGRFRADPYYFATPRSEPELTRELQAAINALNTNDPYFEPMLFAKYYGRNAEQSVVLSAAEQAYVAAEPVVRVPAYSTSYSAVRLPPPSPPRLVRATEAPVYRSAKLVVPAYLCTISTSWLARAV